MTKDDFAERLRSEGYHAENENGCVMVLSDHDIMPELTALAEAADYHGSYGWRIST